MPGYGRIEIENLDDHMIKRIEVLEKRMEELAEKIENLELELKCTDNRIDRLVYGDDY